MADSSGRRVGTIGTQPLDKAAAANAAVPPSLSSLWPILFQAVDEEDGDQAPGNGSLPAVGKPTGADAPRTAAAADLEKEIKEEGFADLARRLRGLPTSEPVMVARNLSRLAV
ncbi:hypothetical protein HDU96_008992 [Phlyctochytrium bullatum]|nr:hypothetical protein HDU96_008992 [Phlyctochytrium bullatum]